MPLLSVPLLPGVVVPVKVPFMGQIDLFKNYSSLIGLFFLKRNKKKTGENINMKVKLALLVEGDPKVPFQ